MSERRKDALDRVIVAFDSWDEDHTGSSYNRLRDAVNAARGSTPMPSSDDRLDVDFDLDDVETCDHEAPPFRESGLRLECEREPGHEGHHSAFIEDEDRVEWDNDGIVLRDPRGEFGAASN